jgi:sugar lactone lactonase YvrE
MPVRDPAMPCLGDPNLGRLCVTSGVPADVQDRRPLAGSAFMLELGLPGTPSPFIEDEP